ncbi:hypothetical protein Pyn_17606 [Prunus yedoensis var. nudiflora]|uniref:Uncharacterized protein n=1 Tax=Prunus yedoensis var. nudiflora TaxID=2094558 RepID=A0A314YYD6_PRUYE|nr:hypothetical protein Pyn_17606 [Prunus yedoensis var. nudiflora]
MFSHPDGGSQYGGSEYEGFQFEDVEDLEDDETTFTQPNPQPSSAQQKRPAQDVASGPNHPRRKVNVLNEMSNKFELMAKAVAGMAPQLAGLVNVLSTKKDLADMQAKLGGELRKIEFLSPLQVFRITNVLAKEHDLLRVIFTMTNEEKKDYVFNHGLFMYMPPVLSKLSQITTCALKRLKIPPTLLKTVSRYSFRQY